MSNENEVREVSGKFYAGLNQMFEGDLSKIEDTWSHDASATAMHPVNGREIGWEEVRKAFALFAELASSGTVELCDQFIRVLGDVAYEMGIESGQVGLAGKTINFAQRVTNIYKREDGRWKMIHHHTDVSQPMIDAVSQLHQEEHKVRQ